MFQICSKPVPNVPKIGCFCLFLKSVIVLFQDLGKKIVFGKIYQTLYKKYTLNILKLSYKKALFIVTKVSPLGSSVYIGRFRSSLIRKMITNKTKIAVDFL